MHFFLFDSLCLNWKPVNLNDPIGGIWTGRTIYFTLLFYQRLGLASLTTSLTFWYLSGIKKNLTYDEIDRYTNYIYLYWNGFVGWLIIKFFHILVFTRILSLLMIFWIVKSMNLKRIRVSNEFNWYCKEYFVLKSKSTWRPERRTDNNTL